MSNTDALRRATSGDPEQERRLVVLVPLVLEERPVDLALIVGAAVESARPSAETKGIELRWSVGDAAASVVLGDEKRLVSSSPVALYQARRPWPGPPAARGDRRPTRRGDRRSGRSG
jgi:signal transduction histidine kinase